ncbi:MAG TPA: hypothetical protein VFI93_07105, partial [Rhizomicrobium sp.]|nr:hypothetical protein [Rhizomicrobium sp.]
AIRASPDGEMPEFGDWVIGLPVMDLSAMDIRVCPPYLTARRTARKAILRPQARDIFSARRQ